VKQARVSLDREQWKLACRSELDAHIKNDTFVESMNPTLNHDLAVKQIIRYLAGTAQLRLRYEPFKVKRAGWLLNRPASQKGAGWLLTPQ